MLLMLLHHRSGMSGWSLLENNTHKVELSMPRFKYEYKRLLNDDLINLGMGIAFSDWADFTNISDQAA